MDFYYFPPSPPCRAVEMCAKAVGVELNKKLLNLFSGEHLNPEYIKLNPQSSVPTIVDNGFTIWESRAILVYLAQKYDKSGLLYPKVPKVKAVINQRLYFDIDVFYKSFGDFYVPIIFKQLPPDPTKFPAIEAAFELLETFLSGKLYVADTDTYTIADIALVTSMTNFDVVGFDYSKYPSVAKWYANCKQVVPGFAENVVACKTLSQFKPKQ